MDPSRRRSSERLDGVPTTTTSVEKETSVAPLVCENRWSSLREWRHSENATRKRVRSNRALAKILTPKLSSSSLVRQPPPEPASSTSRERVSRSDHAEEGLLAFTNQCNSMSTTSTTPMHIFLFELFLTTKPTMNRALQRTFSPVNTTISCDTLFASNAPYSLLSRHQERRERGVNDDEHEEQLAAVGCSSHVQLWLRDDHESPSSILRNRCCGTL